MTRNFKYRNHIFKFSLLSLLIGSYFLFCGLVLAVDEFHLNPITGQLDLVNSADTSAFGVAGFDCNVQYNNGGSTFGGEDELCYDDVNKILLIDGVTAAGASHYLSADGSAIFNGQGENGRIIIFRSDSNNNMLVISNDSVGVGKQPLYTFDMTKTSNFSGVELRGAQFSVTNGSTTEARLVGVRIDADSSGNDGNENVYGLYVDTTAGTGSGVSEMYGVYSDLSAGVAASTKVALRGIGGGGIGMGVYGSSSSSTGFGGRFDNSNGGVALRVLKSGGSEPAVDIADQSSPSGQTVKIASQTTNNAIEAIRPSSITGSQPLLDYQILGTTDAQTIATYRTDGTGKLGSWLNDNVEFDFISNDGVVTVRQGLTSTASTYARVGGVIEDFIFDVGNVGTGADDLYSTTTAANILGASGFKLRAEYSGTATADATDTRELKVLFAGSEIYASTPQVAASAAPWNLKVLITRETADAVKCFVDASSTTDYPIKGSQYTRLTGVTFSGTNVLKITGESAGTTVSNNDVVANFATIEYLPSEQ